MVVFPIFYRGCLPSINSITSETSHPAGSHNAAFFVTCEGRGGGGRVGKYPTLAAQTTSSEKGESGASGWDTTWRSIPGLVNGSLGAC